MQRGPLRPMMTGCILYLLLMAILFLLSGFLFVQVTLLLVLIMGALLCAHLASKEMTILPRLLSSRSFCIGMLVPIILAAVGVFSVMNNYHALQVTEETTVSVSGVVERVYYATDSGAAFLLDLKQKDGKRQGGKIRVQSTGAAYYAEEGERITCTVVLGVAAQIDEYAENIQYAFPDGIFAYAEIHDRIEPQGTGFSFSGLCDRIAAWCKQRFYQYLTPEAAELSIGVMLGDKSVLSAEVKRDFRRVGASHILAVSGMHFSILIGGLLFAMQKAGVGMRLRYTASLVFIFIYIGVIGFSPSVVRAGVMWMLICIAHLIHVQTDALTSLFSAAALMCFLSPQAIFDIGFLLSVSASLGLILLMPPLNNKMSELTFFQKPCGKLLRSILELTAMTLAASVFTMPITLSVFGELSLIAPLANLLLHIPISVMLYISPLLLLLSPISVLPPVGWIVRFFAGMLSGDAALICDLVGWLSRTENVIIGVRYVFTGVLLGVFLIGFLYLYHRTHHILLVFPAYGVFLLSLFLSIQIHAYMNRDTVAVTYDVYRKNDVISITTDGRGMIIDASDGSYASAQYAWEQLSVQNITELDVYFLTHYHTRHLNTFSKLIQNTVVETLVIPIPLTEDEENISAALREIAVNAGIGVQMYRRGEDDVLFGDAVLSPYPYAMLKRSAQPVLGWTVSAHGEALVYLGGAAFETDDNESFSRLRDDALSRCDTLFLGIHGPLYKASLPTLTDVLPDSAAIVCADDAIQSLLHPEDLSAHLTYSIARDGAVRVILDGGN